MEGARAEADVCVTGECSRQNLRSTMMPRSKSNPETIAQRRAAVAKCTSTTNWSDCFVNADEFPQIVAVEDRAKYQWPAPPDLNENQLRMVGWTESELRSLHA